MRENSDPVEQQHLHRNSRSRRENKAFVYSKEKASDEISFLNVKSL